MTTTQSAHSMPEEAYNFNSYESLPNVTFDEAMGDSRASTPILDREVNSSRCSSSSSYTIPCMSPTVSNTRPIRNHRDAVVLSVGGNEEELAEEYYTTDSIMNGTAGARSGTSSPIFTPPRKNRDGRRYGFSPPPDTVITIPPQIDENSPASAVRGNQPIKRQQSQWTGPNSPFRKYHTAGGLASPDSDNGHVSQHQDEICGFDSSTTLVGKGSIGSIDSVASGSVRNGHYSPSRSENIIETRTLHHHRYPSHDEYGSNSMYHSSSHTRTRHSPSCRDNHARRKYEGPENIPPPNPPPACPPPTSPPPPTTPLRQTRHHPQTPQEKMRYPLCSPHNNHRGDQKSLHRLPSTSTATLTSQRPPSHTITGSTTSPAPIAREAPCTPSSICSYSSSTSYRHHYSSPSRRSGTPPSSQLQSRFSMDDDPPRGASASGSATSSSFGHDILSHLSLMHSRHRNTTSSPASLSVSMGGYERRGSASGHSCNASGTSGSPGTVGCRCSSFPGLKHWVSNTLGKLDKKLRRVTSSPSSISASTITAPGKTNTLIAMGVSKEYGSPPSNIASRRTTTGNAYMAGSGNSTRNCPTRNSYMDFATSPPRAAPFPPAPPNTPAEREKIRTPGYRHTHDLRAHHFTVSSSGGNFAAYTTPAVTCPAPDVPYNKRRPQSKDTDKSSSPRSPHFPATSPTSPYSLATLTKQDIHLLNKTHPGLVKRPRKRVKVKAVNERMNLSNVWLVTPEVEDEGREGGASAGSRLWISPSKGEAVEQKSWLLKWRKGVRKVVGGAEV